MTGDLVHLSRKQVKNADRVGGIVLHIPWPTGILREPNDLTTSWRPARTQELGVLHRLLCAPERLQEDDLVLVNGYACLAKLPAPTEPRPIVPCLVAIIIGRRWVKAVLPRNFRPPVAWHLGQPVSKDD